MRLLALFIFLAFCAPAWADQAIPPGLYKVRVHTVLPHIDTSNYDFEAEICWRGPDDPEMPLGPLGRGPLRDCPAEASETGKRLSVTTTCPGPNAGFAVGTYRRTPSGFRGRVELNLGGKNMTLAEEQRGELIGFCGG